jgi:uncharacterized protein YdaU (DUF1376 family)
LNYYPFHIGDYISATRHLSWDEDAAYRRLLDIYYTTEKPIPTELRAVYRLVLATTEEQRAAVKAVLEEFFEATENGWVNHRADTEIETMRDKQQAQRDKANKRWAKQRAEPGTPAAMPRHTGSDAVASVSDAEAMPPTPTPTPTRHASRVPSGATPQSAPPVAQDPTRRGLLCRSLREAGIQDASPHLLTDADWEAILDRRTNEEILEYAIATRERRIGMRTGLKYLAPGLLEDPRPSGSGKPAGVMNLQQGRALAAASSLADFTGATTQGENQNGRTIEHRSGRIFDSAAFATRGD